MIGILKLEIKEIEKDIKEKKKALEKIKKLVNLKSRLESLELTDEIIEKNRLQREKTFNGLIAKEWTSYSKSVWNDLSSQRNKKHLDHGATFSRKIS